ncbi:15877_t:CDS:2 [Entrophospora sp. SA101]|nr:15877_t:CDS:2 [Entrophospora sp. SA101]
MRSEEPLHSNNKPKVKVTYGKQKLIESSKSLISEQHFIKDSIQTASLITKENFNNENSFINKSFIDQTATNALNSNQKSIQDFFKPLLLIHNNTINNSCNSSSNYSRQNKYIIPHFKTSFSSTTTTDKSMTSIKQKKHSGEQLFLELGQKNFSFYTCPECKMCYSRGISEDDALHSKYHRAVIGGIIYSSYKNEVILEQCLKDNKELNASELNEKRLKHGKIFFVDPPVQAVCGINRLWVCEKFRRKGIATKLINHVSNGKAFAIRYTGTTEFLIYPDE